MCYNNSAMKQSMRIGISGLLLGLLVATAGCTAGEAPEASAQAPAAQALVVVGSARELIAFFEEGGAAVQLAADIDLGDVMLKLESGRGLVTIQGDGHMLSGDAPCIIRVAQGGALRLEKLQLQAEKTGIGFLGGGELYAEGCAIEAGGNAIQAAESLRLLPGSSLSATSREGAAILCVGLELGENCSLQAKGDLFALNTGRGDILLEIGAQAACEAAGDNAVKTDGVLELRAGSRFEARNAGEHNAAKVGGLEADASATLELTGGENGVGLFVVELYKDVTVRGFCKPESRVETGKGELLFMN